MDFAIFVKIAISVILANRNEPEILKRPLLYFEFILIHGIFFCLEVSGGLAVLASLTSFERGLP